MKAANKKLFFNLVFTLVGTFILLTMGAIVSANFVKDSRLLNMTSKVADSAAAPTTSTETTSAGTTGTEPTYKYTRAADAVVTKKDYGEDIPKATPTPTSAPQSIKIEVVNYSGIKNLAEDVREVLEANGYIVSTSNAKSNKPVSTTIIEWNDKKVGEEVQKLLKAGRIVKSLDPDSRFDVTIKIGDDFKP